MALRIIFMGTPDFSVPVLSALSEVGHEMIACYTQPPRPAGRRGLELIPSPVQRRAEELGIPVFCPASFKTEEAVKEFAAHEADVAVVVAYGMLLPQTILDAPKHGCYNGHASLLPRWRGAAPIQRAIMAGDDESGIMVMKMEAGLDTGPVAMTACVEISPSTTAGDLHDELSEEGAALMVRAMASLEDGTLELTPQSEVGVTYAKKISKSETRIDWTKPAGQVHRHIMGLSPFPGAWTELEFSGKAQRVKILRSEVTEGSGQPGTALDNELTIACSDKSIRLLALQRAGSKVMEAKEFLRGASIESGTILQ